MVRRDGGGAPPRTGVGAVVGLVRSFPLVSFFLLAFLLSWSWFLLSLGVWRLPFQGPAGFLATVLGPGLSAFAMTALLRGREGVLQLLRRLVRWRVAPRWYLLAVVAWPALVVAAVLAVPGALDAARVPDVGFVPAFLGVYLVILVFGGPLGEEPGWRGFALPGLQQRLGPLAGALVLGSLHAAWHLPLYLLVPGYNGAPPDAVGTAVAFVVFALGVTAGSVVVTWLFNNTRGSLLIAMLHHATGNSVGVVLAAVLPGWNAMPAFGVIRPVLSVAFALVLVVATRGQLSYARYRRETAADGLWPPA